MKVPKAEVDHWLEQAREERLPATPPKVAPGQHQHPQGPIHLEDDEDGSYD